MNDELKEISETLRKIEDKIEDKNPTSRYSWTNFLDYEKMQEKSRKEREEERNEENLKIQEDQSKMMGIQTESLKRQENFNKLVAFTGGILALITIYDFLVQSISLINNQTTYWIITLIFLSLVLLCLGPLISFIISFWKEEFFRKSKE